MFVVLLSQAVEPSGGVAWLKGTDHQQVCFVTQVLLPDPPREEQSLSVMGSPESKPSIVRPRVPFLAPQERRQHQSHVIRILVTIEAEG